MVFVPPAPAGGIILPLTGVVMNNEKRGLKPFAWVIQVLVFLLSVLSIKLPNGMPLGMFLLGLAMPNGGGVPAGWGWLADLMDWAAQFNAAALGGPGPLPPTTAASITTAVLIVFAFLWVCRWTGAMQQGRRIPERLLEACIPLGLFGMAFTNPTAALGLALAHGLFSFNYPPPTEVYGIVVNPDGTVTGGRVK